MQLSVELSKPVLDGGCGLRHPSAGLRAIDGVLATLLGLRAGLDQTRFREP
jgi:hypothetical protein